MDGVDGDEWQPGLPGQVADTLEPEPVERPTVKLRHRVAAVAEQLATAPEFLDCRRVEQDAGKKSVRMPGDVVEGEPAFPLRRGSPPLGEQTGQAAVSPAVHDPEEHRRRVERRDGC